MADALWVALGGQFFMFLVSYVTLNARVAVLEANHAMLAEDILEIKSDVKQLLQRRYRD